MRRRYAPRRCRCLRCRDHRQFGKPVQKHGLELPVWLARHHVWADQLVANLTTSVDKLNAGQGTLGQLLVNAQLYDSLNGATREAQSLLKDIRANPKKFLRIKLGIF